MNFLIYIILGTILVLCIVYYILDETGICQFSYDVDDVIKSVGIIDAFCLIISMSFLLELTPYSIYKDNIKNVNQYESVMYELKHPEEFREIDRIHDARNWNDKYDSYIYSHDNNIFFGILYPLGDMEGTEHIAIEKYLGE